MSTGIGRLSYESWASNTGRPSRYGLGGFCSRARFGFT